MRAPRDAAAAAAAHLCSGGNHTMFDWRIIVVITTLIIGYANGSNDNFKGVATLFGSGTTDYRKALGWATITTLAGSVTAIFLTGKLISVFQGKGLVPSQLAGAQPFVAAVVLGAALTVMLATKTGMPISTTHSLTGALLGSGLVGAGFNLGFKTLAINFFMPLFISPLCAAAMATLGFPLLTQMLKRASVNQENCLCIEVGTPSVVTPEGISLVQTTSGLRVIVDSETICAQSQSKAVFGINGRKLLDGIHFLSAGAVSFARGLNDTPKIVALGLVGGALDLQATILTVAGMMMIGGLLNANAVAHTVSKKITGMEPEHGVWANLVTSFLVIFASKWGMPVSTTHVSCGALFGIGIANGRAQWNVIRTIAFAWLLTIPTAALLSGSIYFLIQRL
jgi:inorganic phosphate transporter, PiT family